MPCGRDRPRTMASKAEVATMRSRVTFPLGQTEREIKSLVAIPKERRKRFTPKACKVLGSPKVPPARFLSIVDIKSCPLDPERSPYCQRVVTMWADAIPFPAKQLVG